MSVASTPATSDQPSDAMRWLVRFAVILWITSLALPAMLQGDRALGATVLVAGLLFGWLVLGWAAYANLFFLWAVVRLHAGREADRQIAFMVGLALTVPLFDGAPSLSGPGRVGVASWGIGAFAWGLALLTLVAAWAVKRRAQPALVVAILSGIAMVSAVFLYREHQKQWQTANAQERAIYLSRGLVYATVSFCGVPLEMPASRLVPEGEAIEIDFPRSANGSASGVLTWTPAIAESDGVRHTEYGSPGNRSNVTVLSRALGARYVLREREIESGAVIEIVDNQTSTVLYSQAVRKRGSRPCPRVQAFSDPAIPSVDSALAVALGERALAPAEPAPLVPETAVDHCNLPPSLPRTRPDGARLWDGRPIHLNSHSEGLPGYCSRSYAILLSLQRDESGRRSAAAYVHERETLRFLDSFHTEPPHPRTPRPVPERVIAVDATADAIIVRLADGEVVASRRSSARKVPTRSSH